MSTDVWKRICYGLYIFIGMICLKYVLDTLLFKFGFEQTAPKIYANISGALGGATASIFFKKDGNKKFDIYFLIIVIVLAIGTYFFVYNWLKKYWIVF